MRIAVIVTTYNRPDTLAAAQSRRHFVRRQRTFSGPCYFVAGNRILLSETCTERILAEPIPIHTYPENHRSHLPENEARLNALLSSNRTFAERGIDLFLEQTST